ncbi:hydroxylamine reductase [Methanolapillus ohkumae]|uniref:Hydroxylamine reductase n=1 Tax=Methanolapillus ohkumae TaxID=3028298 RepID=A0AA96V576_9EURY|nr:Hydroxylamine reductase [Methanosarcinaceae archaeon Am2]
MFCFQCEETMNGTGCTKSGMCGKKEDVSILQDRLIYALKGYAFCNQQGRKKNADDKTFGPFVLEALFSTLTNVNFDAGYFEKMIRETIQRRDAVCQKVCSGACDSVLSGVSKGMADAATISLDKLMTKDPEEIGILATENVDVRSLRETLICGLKGLAAYGTHALILGSEDESVYIFVEKALISTMDDTLSADQLVGLLMECGSFGVKVLALLDTANTQTYGNPVPTAVKTGVRKNPGILISGHDLKDMDMLLEQTKGTGVDVYTHGEMLPAHGYPAFQKYDHLAGNYGNAWWLQKEEFEKFNGPILMTTNCLVPPKDTYADRLFTTNMVGFSDSKTNLKLKHIPVRVDGSKDFSEIVKMAQKCKPPESLEDGTVMTGFSHSATLSVADKVIAAVKAGQIQKFVVMAGCDGRRKERSYYTDFAKALPKDTVILTAGCAKYRYNKLDLGDIGGIPRVLDAGQCNDCYSLVVIAMELAKAFGLENINDLPVVYNIAWYEQKACLVLLALLSLNVQNIVLGPTLPACVSPNVLDVLIKTFNISKNSDVETDMKRLILA